MRTLPLFAIAVGVVVVGHQIASAQAPGSQGAGSAPDFSGVYAPAIFVTAPTVTEPDPYPFTPEAERVFNAYDPLVVAPRQTDDCAAEVMPGVLWSGSPMEIIQEDGRLVIHFERGNIVRSIVMDGTPPPEDQPHTYIGYSVGHWAGDVLTIETTHLLDGGLRNNRGYPMSRDARLTERYWREPGANDLRLELSVDDPANYTRTITLGRDWIWAPDDKLLEWECIDLGSRDSEPDLDELARMLEAL